MSNSYKSILYLSILTISCPISYMNLCLIDKFLRQHIGVDSTSFIDQRFVRSGEECFDSCLRNRVCYDFFFCRNETGLFCKLIDPATIYIVPGGKPGCFYGKLKVCTLVYYLRDFLLLTT